MIDEVKQKILQLVSRQDYIKGLDYDENYIDYIGSSGPTYNLKMQFFVQSERTYRKYLVQVDKHGSEVDAVFCTCPQFRETDSCKHVAACLLLYSDKIFQATSKETLKNKSTSFLNYLDRTLQAPSGPKKEVSLLPYLAFESSYYRDYVVLKVKIGVEKMYSLLGKFAGFMRSYRAGEPFLFGTNFTFDPNKHYFSEKNKKFLEFLEFLQSYNRFNGNSLYLEDRLFAEIIKYFPEGINMEYPERTVLVKKEFPLSPVLRFENETYRFSLGNLEDIRPLTSDFAYVFYDNTIYELNDKEKFLLEECYNERMNEIVVDKKDFEKLKNTVIRYVKNKIEVDASVKDLVITPNPEVKIYFDFNEDFIKAEVKFNYSNKEIDYFLKDETILRDVDYENAVIEDLVKKGFAIEDKQILLEDFEDICAFLDGGLDWLATKYEVFTSEKIKKTKILKNNKVSSTFHLGQDNILRYEFSLGEISESELDGVLSSLKKKKKYYRLKNGNILDLEEESLQELNELSEEFALNEEKEIPKYRALYLDSLKSSKYHIIKTDSLFQKFIQEFKEYQNTSVQFTEEELTVLRDYQVLGVKWLYTLYKCGFGGILADEMGLGKSLQTIYYFRKVLEEKKDATCLIVCPTSLMYNWESEILKFAPEISYHVFGEMKEKRHEELANFKGSIFITSYGLLREDLALYENKNFEVMIIDEAQNIKNPTAGITKAVKKINAKTKFALTGTPIENSIVELWSIFDFIMPGFLASLVKFQAKYKVKDFDEDTNNLLANLKMQVKPFILRRKKKDVVKDLPDKIENTIYIDLNEEQKKIYAAEVKHANEEMNDLIRSGGFAKNKMIILSLLTALRQICISPEIILKDYHGGSSKIENLLKIIKELVLNEHKILLFTSFKTALNLVKDALDNEGISNYTIAGDVPSMKRKMLVDAFNKDKTNVFLIMLKSGGTGLNLTSADVVIHLDLWWNPQAENQATDRTHRIGQTKNVEVIKLICKGTIEEKILDLQTKKKILSDKIIESDMDDSEYLKTLTEQDIRALLAYENKD